MSSVFRTIQDLRRLVVDEGDLPDLNWDEWIRGESPFVTEAMVSRRRAEAGVSLRSLANRVPSLARVLTDVDDANIQRIAETPDVALWSALNDLELSDLLRLRAVQLEGQQAPAAVTAAAQRAVAGVTATESRLREAVFETDGVLFGVVPLLERYIVKKNGAGGPSTALMMPILHLGPAADDRLAINPFYLGLRYPLPGLEPLERVLNPYGLCAVAQNIRATYELVGSIQPGYRDEAARLMRYGVPLTPSPVRIYSGSNSILPGAYFFTAERVPALLAEMLLHETAHSKLFLLQRWDPLAAYEDGIAWHRASYYSPWREDLRPLQGVIHGAFAFTHVALFWAGVAAADLPELWGVHSDLANRRAATLAAEVMFAVENLESGLALTSWGSEVLTALWRECQAIIANVGGGELDRIHSWSPHRNLRDSDLPTVTELLNHHHSVSRELRARAGRS